MCTASAVSNSRVFSGHFLIRTHTAEEPQLNLESAACSGGINT